MSTHDLTKETLKRIFTQYGTAICSEPRRLQAMLYDMTTEPKGKIRALIAIIEEGVANELIQYPAQQVDSHFYGRMVKRLHQNAAIDEKIAEWAIDCWIEALDKSVPPRIQTTTSIRGGTASAAAPLSPSMQQPPPNPSPSAVNSMSAVTAPSVSSQGNAPPPVMPIQSKKSGSPILKLVVIGLLLFGGYKLFLSDDSEGDRAEQMSNRTTVAEEKTEKANGTSAQNDSTPQQAETETDPDLTASVAEQDVRNFIKRYITLGVESINQRDFSLVEGLIDPSGPAYRESQNYLQHVAQKGITEKLISLDVQHVEKADKNLLKVNTYEEYEITYNSESKKFKSFRSEFLVIVLPDRTLKVRELINTTQLESYDIPTEDQASMAVDDETEAVENIIIMHYTSISDGDLTTAYNQFSSDRKRKGTMEGWAKGLQHNIKNELNTIEVTAIEHDSATAYIELTSYDDNGDGTVLVQSWSGYWYLIKENGRWVLDEADIQKLDSWVEDNETF